MPGTDGSAGALGFVRSARGLVPGFIGGDALIGNGSVCRGRRIWPAEVRRCTKRSHHVSDRLGPRAEAELDAYQCIVTMRPLNNARLADKGRRQAREVKLPDFSAVTPQRVREITAESRAQLLIPRQRERENAPYYRVQAEWFKTLAASTRLPKVQASRSRIVASYERLAELAEGNLALADLGEHPGQGSERTHGRAAQSTFERARRAIQQNDDRRIATAALLALSCSLSDVAAALTQEAREKLRDSPRADRFF